MKTTEPFLKTPQPTRIGKRTFQIFSVLLFTAILFVFGFAVWCEIEYGAPALPGEKLGLKIYDRQDNLAFIEIDGRFYTPYPLAKISKSLQNALIVSEDRDFYHHPGVSVGGIARAIFTDVTSQHFTQGGSTLTQQLIKNIYFPEEKRSIWRKLPEAVLAVELEERYTKEQILEAYLNYIYFGRGTYGVEQASERYFGKHASQLDLAESAYLAGLVNAPSQLSANNKEAIARAHEILDNMARLGYATESAVQAAKLKKVVPKSLTTVADVCGYYLNHVVKEVEDDLSDEEPWRDSLRVYTNLDLSAQQLADTVLTRGIRKAPAGVSQGALVSLSVADSAVVAMVGGVGTVEKSPWDRALSPHTAGSAFKPFVYLTGLLAGALKPDTMLDDSPLSVTDPTTNTVWSPKDFEGDYLGLITIRKALALSRNICAVRVAQMVGPDQIVDTARKAGITSKLEPTLALALGASAVSPLEMARAYATLARGGIKDTPIFIRRIDDKNKNPIKVNISKAERVFDAEPVAELVDAMEDVVQKGTGTGARLLDRPVAGKTGTADGARDIWFIGFTPDTVTAVWGGNDENQAIAGKRVTGGSVMAGIWQTFMTGYYKTHSIPVSAFTPPQHPLIEEAEAIHYLPQPAGIFDRMAHFLDPGDFPLNKQPGMPQTAPQRQPSGSADSNAAAGQPKRKGAIGRFFKHVFKWF